MTNTTFYDEEYFQRTHKRATSKSAIDEWDQLINLIGTSNNIKVLDAGCGTGQAIRYISSKTSWDLQGIDFSSNAKVYWGDINAKIGNVNNIPFRDNFFDLVFSSHTFAHFKDPRKFLNEVFRVLKENGKIIIITPNVEYIRVMKPLNELGIIKYNPDPTVINYFSMESLIKFVEENGFIIEKAYFFGEIAEPLKKFEQADSINRFKSRLIVMAKINDCNSNKLK